MLRVDNISVSIHPPRVGRDASVRVLNGILYDVSIHPPRVGRDTGFLQATGYPMAFQSTLPVWGGTRERQAFDAQRQFQSTLPVWGGTGSSLEITSEIEISIHPPRVGRDTDFHRVLALCLGFQSTLPVWGGTRVGALTPHPGCDFNPPSPCGEGQTVTCAKRAR